MAFIFFFFLLAPAVHTEIIDRVVAVVNDSPITLSELNSALAAMGGIKPDMKEERQKIIEMRSKVLDQLIEKKLVEQEAAKVGITISEKEVDNAIEDVKKQNNLGQEELLRALAGMGLTYKEYREQLKEQIRQVKFMNREFRSNVKISKEDVEAYYKQNLNKFSGRPMHRLRIISFPATDQNKRKDVEKLANDVLAMAKEGQSFEKLAREYSRGPNAKEGGDLGYVKAGEMDEAIEKIAAQLKIGEMSEVIVAARGVHIIQLVDRRAAEPKPLEEVENEIRNIIFQKIMDERYKLWIEEMMKKAYIEVKL